MIKSEGTANMYYLEKVVKNTYTSDSTESVHQFIACG